MKYNILKISAMALLAGIAFSCNDAEYQPIENAMYISEISDAVRGAAKLTVRQDTDLAIHARLAQVASKDVNVTFEIDEALMEEYNAQNGTFYTVLPDEYLTFPDKSVKISAGQTTAEDFLIGIKTFQLSDGAAYCIPVRVVSNDGGYDISESSGRIIYLLDAPHKQVVPTMNAATVPSGTGDWAVSTPAWTLEGWVWMDGFWINNQAIFSGAVSSGVEIYCRFGDANVDFDKLQMKTGGSQFESNTKFKPETWYHIAYTYANGKCTLYVNGEEDASKEFDPVSYVINNLTLCGSGEWFHANCKMAQVRFWSKALKADQIRSNMNGEVRPDSEGLFGYWKLDEGKDGVYKDATSNGRDLTCAVAPRWSSEKVDFSNPNAEKE